MKHQQQLVAAVGLVHDVAAHDERGTGRGKLAEVFPELDAQLWVDAHRRLVEEHHARLVHQRTGQRQAAAHATRQLEHGSVAPVEQVDDLERFLERRPVVRSVEGAEEAHVLPDRQLEIDPVGLGHVTQPAEHLAVGHAHAEHARLTGGRLGKAGEQADERCLARAVRPEQAVDAAGIKLEVQVVDGDDAAEALGQTARRYRRRRSGLGHGRSPAMETATRSSTAASTLTSDDANRSSAGRVSR